MEERNVGTIGGESPQQERFVNLDFAIIYFMEWPVMFLF